MSSATPPPPRRRPRHRRHLWQAGLMMLAIAAVLRLLNGVPVFTVAVIAVLGGWFVLDAAPGTGLRAPQVPPPHGRSLHQRLQALLADWVPWAIGGMVALSGIAEISVALLHPRALIAPGGGDFTTDPTTTHAVVLPAGLLLIVAGSYLVRRRHGAWVIALVILTVLGAVAMVRRDVDGAVQNWAMAGVLVWGRRAFHVRQARNALSEGLRRAPLIIGGTIGIAALTVGAAAGHTDPPLTAMRLVRWTTQLLLLQDASVRFTPRLRWIPTGVALLTGAALLALVWPLVRRLAPAPERPTLVARTQAARLVRRFGDDTLSFFKLRNDIQYLFTPTRTAFLGYRVQHGVMVISGDPVGDHDAFPDLLDQAIVFARAHALRLAVLGAGVQTRPMYEEVGMRSIYLGDEAIIDTQAFSLDGRPIRKVRQSVTRLTKAGYTALLCRAGDLGAEELADLERVSAQWRGGEPERGFSMAMDRIDPVAHPDGLVLRARDAGGAVRGFLHLVPCAGHRASLSLMRREQDTPNGLTEFMVTEAIAGARELGITHISLNFATFGRFLRDPEPLLERILGRLVRLGDRWFQIERLRSFNAKFFPQWQARYLVIDGWISTPHIAWACLSLEGYLPRWLGGGTGAGTPAEVTPESPAGV